MRISEPTTTLTDYVLAAVAFALAARLASAARSRGQRSMSLWAAGFAASAAAAALGGTYHGFARSLDPVALDVLRRLTLLLIGLSSLVTVCGTTLATVCGVVRRVWLALAIGKFAVFVVVSSLYRDYVVAVVDYAAAALAILLLEFRGSGDEFGGRRHWFALGFLVSFAAAVLHQAHVGFHQSFNHNDVYHSIQTAALFLLYKGAARLRDAT